MLLFFAFLRELFWFWRNLETGMRSYPIIPVSLLTVLALLLPVWSQEEKPKPADQPLLPDSQNDLFELAVRTYREAGEQKNAARQKETYMAAIRQFDRFHTSHSKHPNAIKSWYYAAICHQKVGDLKNYRRYLAKVVTTWSKGPLVGAAAYQLALAHYKAEQYDKAEPLYLKSAAETDSDNFRHRAIYSRALCFEKLGKAQETIMALKAVLADEGSPFLVQAERVLAHYYKKAGAEEEAMAHFINLSNSKDPKTKADAVLQTALLARSLNKRDFARRYFEEILVTPGLEEWRGEAQLSLMSEASLASNHQAVVDYYQKGKYPLDLDPKARRLQIAASAYEALGDKDQSTALFAELARIAPDNMTAFEAGYVVLSREYKTGSGKLIKMAEDFLKRFEQNHPNEARIHNARLMLAEGHYKAKRYPPAASAYGTIDLKHIAKENHAGLHYRLATSLLHSDQRQRALEAFNVFIEKHPDHPQATSAIVKRADSFLEAKDAPKAHLELERLLKFSQDPQLMEYAWAQKAILYKEAVGHSIDDAAKNRILAKFAECHGRLLADFPKRDPKKRAASEFWRGWAFYRKNEFDLCILPFKRARKANESLLGREASLHLALANYHLQKRDDLKTELDALIKNYPKEKVPRPVFAWLGTSFAAEKNYPEGWRYLKHAITPTKPAETKVVVWRAAGRSALEAGAYEEALRPLAIVLQVEENQFRKAETHFFLGSAHLALKDTERARKAAESCLELKPQGILNAKARLLLGDIAMAQGNPNTAAQYYVPVVELYSKDPTIAHKALLRAISSLDLKGDEASKKSAKRYRAQLQKLQNATKSGTGD